MFDKGHVRNFRWFACIHGPDSSKREGPDEQQTQAHFFILEGEFKARKRVMVTTKALPLAPHVLQVRYPKYRGKRGFEEKVGAGLGRKRATLEIQGFPAPPN